MSQKYLIAWEKWKDPILEEQKLSLDDKNHENENENLDEDDGYDKSIMELMKEDLFAKPKNLQLIRTPSGDITLPEYTGPNQVYNFWSGHTNFNLTPAICKIIEKIDGVETLDIFTRYRMRVGIGKLFHPNEVTSNITNQIIKFLHLNVSTKKA